MALILDKINGELINSEIVELKSNEIPLKKDGWKFNWRHLSKEVDSFTYGLRTIESPSHIQGALHLKIEYDVLIMNALELAPHNIGQKSKRYGYVAGCLIAFACKESFKIKGDYKGFLTFVSKTSLIEWYIKKYRAVLALGQRMYIDWDAGEKLIEEYLNRTKK